MSKKSAIKRHVQTSIVARVVYRIICLVLIVAGLFGLNLAYDTGSVHNAYNRRNDKATATVTKWTKETDKYGHEDCAIEYKFKVNGEEYTSNVVTNAIPTNYNCDLHQGDEITVRYEAARPTNNSYGDSERIQSLWLTSTVVLTILSIIPLGVGFVGLVAIHKALKAEDALEEAEAAVARKRVYRRQTKKANKELEDKE